MSLVRKIDHSGKDFAKVYKKYNEEKEISDEGVFINGDDMDDEEDDDYYMRQPKTEFEKGLAKINGIVYQVEQDTQFLCHDLKVVELKNESTERRILKLSRDVAEFRLRLTAFLNSFRRHSSVREFDRVTMTSADHMTMKSSPRYQKTTMDIFLKQNSREQPVHVNMAVR